MSADKPVALDVASDLLSLPPGIQRELLDIARTAMDMTAGEKGYAAALFATVGLHYGLGKGSDDMIPGAQMVATLGVILRLANDEVIRNDSTQ